MRMRMVIVVGALAVLCGSAGEAHTASAQGESRKESSLYDPKGKRDPFVPLVRNGKLVGPRKSGPAGTLDTPVLRGIVWDPHGHSIALINDTEVKVGDLFGEYRVSAIQQHQVTLIDRDGEPLELTIAFEEENKPKSSQDAGGGERP